MSKITYATELGICVDSALLLDDLTLKHLRRLRRLIGIQELRGTV